MSSISLSSLVRLFSELGKVVKVDEGVVKLERTGVGFLSALLTTFGLVVGAVVAVVL